MRLDNPATSATCLAPTYLHQRRHHGLFRLIPMVAVAVCAFNLPSGAIAQSGAIVLPSDSDAPPPASGAVQVRPAIKGVDVDAGDLKAAIRLAQATAHPGAKVSFDVHFSVAPGWHIYGAPLPPGEDLTSTAIAFDDRIAAHQSIAMPPPAPLRFAALNETLPVYQGDFAAAGQLQLKPDLKPGPQMLNGTLSF